MYKFHWQENSYGSRALQVHLHVISCWTKVQGFGRNLLPCPLASARPNFRLEDVWGPGKLLATEHAEILYLPPNLPGSTPKKTKPISSQTREETPDLEEMNHQELVDLVKELLQGRVNRHPPTIPNKDIPTAGHVTMKQESLVQSSQAILQGLAEGGFLHTKTPKFECFFGDDKRTSWILICGKDRFCLQPQAIQVQP